MACRHVTAKVRGIVLRSCPNQPRAATLEEAASRCCLKQGVLLNCKTFGALCSPSRDLQAGWLRLLCSVTP